jgi:hypothetical protein
MPRRMRSSTFMLIAALISIATWPGAAEARGLPPAVAVFVLAFFVFAAAAIAFADFYAIKRWLLPDHARAAALQSIVVTAVTAIAGTYVMEQLGRYVPNRVEPIHVGAARMLRVYDVPIGVVLVTLAIVLAKALFLRWRFAVPVSWRTLKVLGLANLLSVGAAGLAAAAVAYFWR